MISRENIIDLYPLTPMQEGMLFHALRDAASRAYHEQVIYELTGPLAPALFERAWQTLVDRHDVLRTVFVYEKAERPLQAVLKNATIPFSYRDLRDLPAPRRRETVDTYVADDRARGFDLRRDIALRLAVFRIEDARHIVIWSFHHILLDGWSTGLVVAELATVYDALRTGSAPALSPPVRFARYVSWLQERDAEAAKAYWHATLAGYEGRIDIPGGPNHGRADRYEHGEVIVDFDDWSAKVRDVATRLQVTPYTLVQTAWSVLLGRANQTGDVVFGSIVSGRPPSVPGIESMVGLFINAVPVRVTFKEGDSLETIARRIQQASLDANDHSFLPLSESGAGSLVTHVLAYQSYPVNISAAASKDEDALRVESVRSLERTHYDFTFMVTPGDRLRLTFIFNRLVYSEEAVRAIAANLQTTLRALVDDPGRSVTDTPIQADEEYQRQLAWADTAGDYPSDCTLHELFEDFEPDRIAVVDGQVCLTYAELNRRANQLAHELRRRGVGPDGIVGVANVRSAEMIVGVLAILKAGGAYLGIEPDWPEERVRLILDDAGVDTVITKAPATATLEATGRDILSLNLHETWAGPETAPVVPMSSGNLAYVCYTSGSTGRPKGVEVQHRSVVRLVRNTDYAGFWPGNAILQFSPLSFDVQAFELWGALLNKGKLVVVTESQPTLEDLGTLIREQGLDTVWLTSGLFVAMVDEHIEDFAGVRQCLTGGDVVSPLHARRVLEAHPQLVLINGYGPTESTTYTTCHRMAAAADVENPVSIGSPIANTRVYVLDNARRPLPIGASGELFIGGDGLARGYRNRRSLTAERFVPDPFGSPGGRMYTTGDLVRFRRDGTLEFQGRRDDQVKIRGFRVEPGELEAVINAAPEVRTCVVTVERNGETSLVAYVVPEDLNRFEVAALRSKLETKVPHFLMPSAIVTLPALPLTANGKVDRRRLLEAAGRGRPAGTEIHVHVEPATETERQIVSIWCEVLGVERVSVTDDFFELGGHSLSALRVVSRLRKVLGVEVPLPLMFNAPTISGFAAAMDAREGSKTSPPKPLARRARVPITVDVPSAG